MTKVDAKKIFDQVKGIFDLINSPFTGGERVSFYDQTVSGRWIWEDLPRCQHQVSGMSKIYQTLDGKFHLATGGDIPEKILPAAIFRIVIEATQGYGTTRRPYYAMTSSFESMEQGFQHIMEMLELCVKEDWSVLVFDSQGLSSKNLPGIIVKTSWPHDDLGHDWLAIIAKPIGRVILEAFEGQDGRIYEPQWNRGNSHSTGSLRFQPTS